MISRSAPHPETGLPAQTSSDGHLAASGAHLFDGGSLPTLARRAVETYILKQTVYATDPASLSSLLRQPSACFVCIKTLEGELRGCIGTINPSRYTLAEETVFNAISAATRDHRFQPVSEAELPRLRYTVDILEKPEATCFEDLDPANFGVIVQAETGPRHGLLLPQLKGIESAEQQVQIAARKAGIALDQPHRLYRFRVRRFSEEVA